MPVREGAHRSGGRRTVTGCEARPPEARDLPGVEQHPVGTITAGLQQAHNLFQFIEARRAQAGKLYSVEEFAAEVAAMVTADVENGHTEYVGGPAYAEVSVTD